MKKTILVGLALAIVGTGTAFFIISHSDDINAPGSRSAGFSLYR